MPQDPSKRDYKKEYARDHSSTTAKKHRAQRNNARRAAVRKHGASALVGKDVDHIKPLSQGGSNAPSNRRIISTKKNRGRNN